MGGVDTLYDCIERCVPDLYRMAYLSLGRQDHACDTVTKACIKGARTLTHISDERELKIALTGLLYRRCLHRLWIHAPDMYKLPELFQAADKRQRLILVVRFGAGLRSEEARRAMGLSKSVFYHRLACAARAVKENINR